MEKFDVKKIDKDVFRILLSKRLYEKEAILNATYNYSNLGYFKLDNFDDNNVALIFKLKNYGSQIDVEMIIGNLYNEINEQQMRLDLESRMGKIRDLIYEKACAPLRKRR